MIVLEKARRGPPVILSTTPKIDPADGHHDSSRDPGITPADGNVDSSLDAGIDGKRTSKAGRKTARVDSCNHDKRAKAGGKVRGNQSGNDDAVESSDYHNNSIAKAGGKAHGNQSGNDDAVESSDYHNNSIAKAGGKARGNQSGNDDAVESSDYHNNSIPDHKTHGSGCTRKPPAKNCKCLLYIPIHLHCFQYNQIECIRFFCTSI